MSIWSLTLVSGISMTNIWDKPLIKQSSIIYIIKLILLSNQILLVLVAFDHTYLSYYINFAQLASSKNIIFLNVHKLVACHNGLGEFNELESMKRTSKKSDHFCCYTNVITQKYLKKIFIFVML